MAKRAVFFRLATGLVDRWTPYDPVGAVPETPAGYGRLEPDQDIPTFEERQAGATDPAIPLYVIDGQPIYDLADLPAEVQSQVEAEALATARAAAIRAIDAQAEERRLRRLTPGTGQMAVYAAKEAEAEACLAAAAPNPADYPFLAASAQARGLSLAHEAAQVLDRAQAWRQTGAALEGVRLAAKKAVAEAPDPAAVAAVLAGVPSALAQATAQG